MEPLASVDDVVTVWRPTSGPDETARVENLIQVASAKLRQACPFSIDARMLLFAHQPNDPIALNPAVVASVVATIVKRFLVNPDGVVNSTETAGIYSRAQSFVNRYDKAGSDVRGAIQVIGSDIDELRPSTPTRIPGAIQMVPTRAMEPAPGYWPNGYRPRTDPATGDPAFGFPYDRTYDYDASVLNPSLRVPLTTAQLSNAKNQTITTIRAVGSSDTAAAGEELVVTTGSSVVTVTLPVPTNGALVVVKKADAGSSGGSVTVVPAKPDQHINNAGSFAIFAQYQSVDFVSDGADWWAA